MGFRAIFLFVLWVVAAGAWALDRTAFVLSDDVQVTRLAEGFRIDVEMQAPVSPALAWKVLTDFENMPRFVPNLSDSRITATTRDKLTVVQHGKAKFGPFSQDFESIREISLVPNREILARQTSGTARKMESRMRLSAQADGSCRLEYRAEIVPETALPPLLGPAFVRHEIAEQFSAMIAEMVKRHQQALPQH